MFLSLRIEKLRKAKDLLMSSFISKYCVCMCARAHTYACMKDYIFIVFGFLHAMSALLSYHV
jgi:hypothetical protein